MDLFWQVPLTIIAGICAGMINAVAGGGSLIALQALILVGLPNRTANGSNRIAQLFQNMSGVAGYYRKGVCDLKSGITFAIPTAIGAVLGATIAVKISEHHFDRVLAMVMVAITGVVVLRPPRTELIKAKKNERLTKSQKIIVMAILFLIGIYGGFIQAGTGFLIIAALTSTHSFTLVRINAIKLFIILFYTVFALAIFAGNGSINWFFGSTLAIGNSIGVWIGSHVAVDKGEKWSKSVLVIAVVLFITIKLWESLS